MSKYLTAGSIAGILTFVAAISTAIGKPALGAFLSDPNTAGTVTAVVTGVGALIAGVLTGIKPAA